MRVRHTLLVVPVLLMLGACVAERESSRRGTKVTPQTRVAEPTARPAPTLPSGPIASPAKGRTTISRVSVNVAPIGEIEYNGLQLPLISPDGKKAVSQLGTAPAWETLIGEVDAPPAPAATFLAHALSREGLKLIEWIEQPQSGVLLGRMADDEGFLIEWPREDGSRWIGKTNWATGSTQWLVQGADYAMHGVLTPSGELMFARRSITDNRIALVVRSRDGSEIARFADDGDYLAPLPYMAEDLVYALRASSRGVDVEAIRLRRNGETAAAFGSTLARQNLTGEASLAAAFQLLMTVAPSLPAEALAHELPLSILSTKLRAACVFDIDANRLIPILPQSMSATPFVGRQSQGFFASTDRQLSYVPWPPPDQTATSRNDARVLASPYILRPLREIRDDGRTMAGHYIIMGPVKGHPDRIELTMMVPTSD